MEMLNVADVARLRGCSERYVKMLCKNGKLKANKNTNERKRAKYQIPLDALSPQEQQKYRAQKIAHPSTATGMLMRSAEEDHKPMDAYSDAERAEIAAWQQLLERWQQYRSKPDVESKAAVDEHFIALMRLEQPQLQLSTAILYRKWAALRAKQYDGLLDKRGKWRLGTTKTPQEIYDVFTTYYLDESQHPIERCIEYTELYLRRHGQEELVALMPSYSTFRRYAQSIPYPVQVLGRQGEKAYYDLCSPYVRREYESIASNEWWVADTHTFDIISQDGDTRKTHRIYLNAYLDARSGVFTGWYVTANPSSEATLLALRKGILTCGIPRNIYVDNGREYLTYDIGGRGHRAKKVLADGSIPFAPPGVFERLGITMTNAIIKNARAKIIERRFRDVKDHISRLFCTYCGGSVIEKPDRLKGVLKRDKTTTIEASKVVTDKRLIEIVELLISGYLNYQPYNGSVSEDRGKRRIDVYNEHLADMPQRKASPEDLALLLMRTTRPQQVSRNGVFVPMGGKKVWYSSMELRTLMREKVYLRYDPEQIDTVRVYNMDDRYLLSVQRDNHLELPYGASKDDVSVAMAQIRRYDKAVKAGLAAAKLPLADEDTALSLVMGYAQRNLDAAPEVPKANAIELVRATEQPLLEAVGDDTRIDLNTMITNAAARQNEQEDDL